MRWPWWLAAFFLLITVGGAVTTVEHVHAYQWQYMSGLMAVGIMFALTVLALRGPIVINIAALLALVLIFSSYCVKLLFIVVDPGSPVTLGMLPRIGTQYADMPRIWTMSQSLSMYGIASFSIVSIALSRLRFVNVEVKQLQTPPLNDSFWWGAWSAVLLLSLSTAWLSYYFNIGLMGAAVQVELPFHLRGIVYHFRSLFLPAAALLLAFTAYQQRRFPLIWFALGLLAVNALSDALIRSSKSAILVPFLYVFFMVVSAELPIRRKFVMLAILIGTPVLLSMPYLNNLRVFRTAGYDIWDSMALTISTTGFSPIEFLFRSVVWIIYRLPGIEMLIGILDHSPLPSDAGLWEILTRPNGVAGFLTNNVLLVPENHQHLAAPSYFGWWYLLFGKTGVAIGGGILALVVHTGWRVILKIPNQSAVIIRIFFLALLFTALSEGTLDMLLKTFIAMLVTVGLLEACMRIYLHSAHKQIHSSAK